MVPGRFVRLLVDEFDFSGDTSGVTLTLTGSAIDAPALQQTALQRIAGDAGLKVEHSGYYTGPDAGELEAELTARLGTETPAAVAVLLDTRAVGNPAYVAWRAWGEQVTVETPIDGLVTLSGAWGEMPGYRGVVLFDGEVTAVGAGAVVDLGSTAGTGGQVFVFVRSIDGAAVDASVAVESDVVVGMDSPAMLAAVVFSAVGVFAAGIALPVEQYVRMTVDDLGGADGLTLAVVLCVDGVTM
jgi:hypothetical protein